MSDSTGKRAALPAEDNLFNVKISDETQQKFDEIAETIRRTDLANERENIKRFIPVYAERREVLQTIPKFWPVAIMNNPPIAMYIQHQDDQRVLSYLEDVWVERDQHEIRAFTLEFYFSENPYFSDKVLKKGYKYVAPKSTKDEKPDEHGITRSMLDFDWESDIVIEATPISWKSNAVNLTKLHPRIEEEGNIIESGSFFNLFEGQGDPLDFGLTIANEIFADAIDWFTGKAAELLEERSEDEEDEEEDEEDEEEEIDLEKPLPKKQKRN